MPTMHDTTTTLVDPRDLIPHPQNPRQGDVGAIVQSISANGWYGAIIVQRSTGYVLAGNHRLQAAKHLGIDAVPVMHLDVTDDQALRILVADNRTNDLADYDTEGLVTLLQMLADTDDGLTGTAFDGDDLDDLIADLGRDPSTGGPPADGPAVRPIGNLTERFGAPPFSTLDTRQGYWQDRKRAWIALGLQSELGRDAVAIHGQNALNAYSKPTARRSNADSRTNVTGSPDAPAWSHNGLARMTSGTSIFDPVLAELMVRWYAPSGGTILDPFAGGSVRGIVAAALGRQYIGVDLRAEQVQANEAQWQDIGPRLPGTSTRPTPTWLVGDSAQVLPTLDTHADMILTCPPYGSLEVYSDDPADLSAMPPDVFAHTYARILQAAAAHLRPNRFAVIVVSEYRLPSGAYAGLIPQTISAMRAAGLDYYAEGTLLNAIGTLAIRASAQFVGSRKLLRSHQNVLIFVKGDHKAAAAACDTSEDATTDLDDQADTTTPAYEVVSS